MNNILNKDVCEGYGCSMKVTNCIEVTGGKKGNIILYLCDSCAKLFDDPLCNTEKDIGATGCGTGVLQCQLIQPSQQSGGLLDD